MKFLCLFGEQVEEPALGALVLPLRQVLRQIAIPAVRHLACLACTTAKAVAKLSVYLGGSHVWDLPPGKTASHVGA